MSSIIKVNNIQDGGGNSIVSSNGSGTFTPGSAMATGVLANTPAFFAYLSSDTNISNQTATKVAFNSEDLDTDNCYDNSTNYRFTPNVAGKYYIGTMLTQQGGTSELIESRIYIYKNGSVYSYSYQANQNNHSNYQTNYQSVIMDMNGTSDYVESFAYISRGGSTSAVLAHTRGTYFMGYRMTGA
jgi:hypothetical protein